MTKHMNAPRGAKPALRMDEVLALQEEGIVPADLLTLVADLHDLHNKEKRRIATERRQEAEHAGWHSWERSEAIRFEVGALRASATRKLIALQERWEKAAFALGRKDRWDELDRLYQFLFKIPLHTKAEGRRKARFITPQAVDEELSIQEWISKR